MDGRVGRSALLESSTAGLLASSTSTADSLLRLVPGGVALKEAQAGHGHEDRLVRLGRGLRGRMSSAGH